MMLEAINLYKYYGARPALEGISFAIDKGETVGFLGVNGAGKSTAMRVITGFLAPTYGQVRLMGLDPTLPKAREKLGYLPESNPLPQEMRVREYLSFRARLKGLPGRQAARAAFEAAGRCRVDTEMDRLIGQLSKGTRQRVGLADALVAKPEILILDEPTTGLDPRQAAETRALIGEAAGETAIFLSSHILHDVEHLCQRVIVINNGRLVADGPTANVCEKNVEERTIRLELLADEPVRETLRSVPGVRAVSILPNQDDDQSVTVKLTIPAGVDLRRDISAICAKRGWLVTEMHLEPVRLEDIFRRLTASA